MSRKRVRAGARRGAFPGVIPGAIPGVLLSVMALGGIATPALGQFEVPVYVDDSATAAEAVARARQLAGVGNVREAIDVFQRLLDDQGERVLAVEGDADLYRSVRQRIEGLLIADAPLRDRYEEIQGPVASRMLEMGQLEELVSTRLMTRAGFEGALRLIQRRIESAHFAQALIELRTLDTHPMRTGESARAALDLLDLVCAYTAGAAEPAQRVASREATILRSRWRESMALDPSEPVEAAETPEVARVITPLEHADAQRLEALLPRALASVQLARDVVDAKGGQTGAHTEMRVMPAVSGDTVFLTDGQSVLAMDRFTLTVRWRVTLPTRTTMPGGPQGAYIYGMRPLDVLVPVVSDDRVFVIGGDGPDDNRMTSSTERVIACLDAGSGRALWMRYLSDLDDEALSECIPRGPALIDQGLLICSAMRINQQKRIVGGYLMAFSLDRGELVWSRNTGSVGTESSQNFARDSSLPAAAGGLIYTIDPVGVIACVESATGRVRWVRRLEKTLTRIRNWTSPWRDPEPIIHDGKVYIASSSTRTIRVFDAWNGEQLETVDARPLGTPDYILHAGEWLVGVSSTEVKAKPIARLIEPVPVKDVARITDRGIRGRVVIAGDSTVLVPTQDGLLAADLNAPDPIASATTIALEHTGQFVAMSSSLVVADNFNVHSYLVWEQASDLLRQRMEDDPTSAASAVTYAELSYRAGQAGEIVGAVDRALKAISSAPDAGSNELARERLFGALLEMIEAGPEAPVELGMDMRRDLLARLDRTAASSRERVAYLMSAGQMHEMLDQPMRAVETYQRVLENDLLASAEYQKGQTGLPAGAEATRRIRRLVFERGPEIYTVFDAEAQRELARLNWSLSAEPFEELARRYPVSRAAARAWIEAGDRYTTSGQSHMAIFALEEGLRVARLSLPPGDPLTGEAVGRLVHRLEASRRVRDAIRVLDEVITREPELIVLDHGRPADAIAWRGELTEELAQLEHRPDIGALEGNGALLVGMGVVRPEHDTSAGAPTDRVMLYDGASGEVSMWQSGEKGALNKSWDGVFGESLVRIDTGGVLMVRAAVARPRDRVLVMRDPETGTVAWESEPVRSLLPRRDIVDQVVEGRRGGGAFGTPVEMGVMVGELLLLVDTDTIVVLERSGRAAAFDTQTGKHLWSASSGVGRVYDASLGGGVLAVGGLMPPPGVSLDAWGGAGSDAQNGVNALDARTGKPLLSRTESTPIRWVRASEAGGVIFATDLGIAMIDPFRAALVWRNEEGGARLTLDAQIVEDRLIVLGSGGEVRQIAMRDGLMRAMALDARGRMDPARGDAIIAGMKGNTVMASEMGVAVFDASGDLVGVDERATEWRVLPPALAEGKVCTLAQMGQVLAMERSLYEFNVTEVETVRSVENRRVELPAPPRELTVVDNAVVIGTADGVVVIPAPARD